MALEQTSSVELPKHIAPGGFDHAAYHPAGGRLYVAHTINNALDVIDCAGDRYLYSIPHLTGVAGVLVSPETDLIFTSNRGENTVGIFHPNQEKDLIKIPVGLHPNGLSFDPKRGHLLSANVGDPSIPDSFTLSFVDIETKKMVASIPAPGRTRWTLYDPRADVFYVNIADPAQIVVVKGDQADRIARVIPIQAAGPHGLDLDAETNRLFCACDAMRLLMLDAQTGHVQAEVPLSGPPDVIFFNPALQHIYVAVGDPGVIEVVDTSEMRRVQTVTTEKGAHTLGFVPDQNKVYAFLPQSHRALVYQDMGA
jgi:DNA-binding beta-propeller fold protein YncE